MKNIKFYVVVGPYFALCAVGTTSQILNKNIVGIIVSFFFWGAVAGILFSRWMANNDQKILEEIRSRPL